MTAYNTDQMRIVADRLAALSSELSVEAGSILRGHGARIERDAKILTPVDKGFLMNANRYEVGVSGNTATLTVSNRMEYAVYQHEKPMRHKKPGARDHFIKIPFEKRIIGIVADFKRAIREATE